MGIRILWFLVLTLSILSGAAAASDIASSVNGGTNRLADGGDFELGMSVYGINRVDVRQTDDGAAQLSLLISGMYQYKGLFVEMIHQSQDGINLGVNLWSSEDWSLELLLANLQSSWSRPDVDPRTLDEAGRNTKSEPCYWRF